MSANVQKTAKIKEGIGRQKLQKAAELGQSLDRATEIAFEYISQLMQPQTPTFSPLRVNLFQSLTLVGRFHLFLARWVKQGRTSNSYSYRALISFSSSLNLD